MLGFLLLFFGLVIAIRRYLSMSKPDIDLHIPQQSVIPQEPVVPRKAAVRRKRSAPAPAKSVELSELLPQEFIVLDLETTGLSPYTDEIIEFGAIRVTINSQDFPTFQTLVKPERKISHRITEITGITQEMVDAEGMYPEAALTEFVEFIGNLPLVTFNATFDMGFLHSAAKKHGIEINNDYACALQRARHAWPGLPSYRLAELAKIRNLSDDNTHRALGDCKRAMFIFVQATSEIGQKVRWTKPSA